MEDLQLAKSRELQKGTSVTGTTDGVLAPDQRRVAILVSCALYTYFDQTAGAVVADKMTLNAGQTISNGPTILTLSNGVPVMLRIEDLGDLITGPFSITIVNDSSRTVVTLIPIVSNVNVKPYNDGNYK